MLCRWCNIFPLRVRGADVWVRVPNLQSGTKLGTEQYQTTHKTIVKLCKQVFLPNWFLLKRITTFRFIIKVLHATWRDWFTNIDSDGREQSSASLVRLLALSQLIFIVRSKYKSLEYIWRLQFFWFFSSSPLPPVCIFMQMQNHLSSTPS